VEPLKPCSGENLRAIFDSQLWEDIRAEFGSRQRPKANSPRSDQNALLAGLLFCNHCHKPMVATYSTKGKQRYRYYVCRRAQQQGWKSCPTKSVSARLIEDSLISQLRVRLSSDSVRSELRLADRDWQTFLHDTASLVPALVESVRYEGASGTVGVKLRPLKQPNTENSH
jgi:Recombinase zinc beta ribbon domain